MIIPAFNEVDYIANTLVSLARQDFDGNYEVIVVDNNSTDETGAIARSHGAIVVHEEKPGVCSARQRGALLARGEILVSTDADTTFDPAWLSRMDQVFASDPECVAVAGPCVFSDGPWWACYTKLLFGAVSAVHRRTGRVLYVTATNIGFRRTAWTGYDTRLTQGGDELGLIRQLRRQGKVVFRLDNPTFTSARRLHAGFLYSVVVTCFVYYILGYLTNRISHRQLVGTAPAFRKSPRRTSWRRRPVLAGGVVFLLVLGLVGADPIEDLAYEIIGTFS